MIHQRITLRVKEARVVVTKHPGGGKVRFQSTKNSLILLLFLPIFSHAGEGVFLSCNDAIQLGRASSGVASPRSSYWSYMNPASMVDLDRRLDVNLYTVYDSFKLTPRGILGNRLDGTLDSEGLFPIVTTSIILPVETGVLGGGIFVPSGSGVEYPHSRNVVSRIFHANGDRRMALQHIRGVLSYAHQFDNGWSVGFGLHLSVTRFRADHLTLNLSTAAYDNKWDAAYGAGFDVGLYRRWERFALGANYTSRHWMESMGKYGDLLSSPLDMPHSLQVGFAYKLLPSLEITADYRWLLWEEVKAYGSSIFNGGGFGWKDQHGIKLGIEWLAGSKWTLMAGYAYSNSPIQEKGVFLAGLAPVIFEHHVTAGISYQVNEKNAIHFAVGCAPKQQMKESGTGDLLSVLGKGTEIEVNAISACLGYSYLW